MAEHDYEYYGQMAQLWDLLRGDTSDWDDRHFYKAAIEKYGQPALDVGCGTGRLTLDFLQLGIDIDGVDDSPEMLALCRKKARALGLTPNVQRQAMENLDLPRRYRLILVPSSSFQLLTDPDGAAQAMRRFYEHLLPGGWLIMPFMRVGFDANGQPIPSEESTLEVTRPEDGAQVRRWSRSEYDHAAQLEHTQDRYEIIKDGQVIFREDHSRSPATRDYTQQQAVRLYEEAGFVEIQVTSGFTFDPVQPGDSIFCVLGKK